MDKNSLPYVLSNALDFLDNNMQDNKELFDTFRYYTLQHSNSQIEHSKIIFFDEHKKILKEYKCELVGHFYKNTGLWVWAWALPNIPKKLTIIARKLLDYGFNISENDSIVKSQLITSRIIVRNPLQLDIHIALASYLVGAKKVFEAKNILQDYNFTDSETNENTKNNTSDDFDSKLYPISTDAEFAIETPNKNTDYIIHYYILLD